MARASLLATAVTLFVLATPASGRQAEAQVGASRDWAYALALQRDGKLVAAGRSVDGGWRFAVARYTTRGRLDPGFGQGGKILTAVGSTSSASELAIQRDGKLVAAGQAYVGPEQDVAVVRYTSRGRLDTSFGRGGAVVTDFSPRTKTYDYGTGLALHRDGKLVVNVSSVKASEDSARRVLARYTARGRLDRSFGRGGKVVGRAGALERSGGVAIQRDGKIVASGTGRSGFVLARYTARGRLDPSFGQRGTVSTKFRFNGVAIEPDGKIVAVGGASAKFGLARYTADGRLDPSFGDAGIVRTRFSSGISEADGVVVQPDGKIVAAGGGAGYFVLARYTPDGELDPTFGHGGKAQTTLRPAS